MSATVELHGQFVLGDRPVGRVGYCTMKLCGRGGSGPIQDPRAGVAVLRRAVERGIDHIDTSALFGPHLANDLVHEALHPYPEGLTIATRVGGRRTADGGWVEGLSPEEVRHQVQDNLDHLGLDVLDLVYIRLPGVGEPAERSLAEPFEALAALQQEGLVRHLGVSHVTARQVAEAQSIAPLTSVQNHYNLMHRTDDDLVDSLAVQGIAYMALEGMSYTTFFPQGGMSSEQSALLGSVARRVGASPDQVAMAWLLHRAPNVLVAPGASTVAELDAALEAAALVLDPTDMAELGRIISVPEDHLEH